MRKIDLAYVAGLFDGEGSIGIYCKSRGPKERGRYQVQCIVQMTNEFLPKLLQMHFGGSFFADNKFRRPHKCISYRWGVVANQALHFIKAISPYLKIKKAEADLAIEFQERIIRKKNLGNHPLTDKEIALREAQSILMKALKHQGKLPDVIKGEEARIWQEASH